MNNFLYFILRYVRTESFSGLLLLICSFVAIIWANSPLSNLYTEVWSTQITIGIGSLVISKDLIHWINEGLMVFFFLIVGLEIKREIIVGELSEFKKALFPIVAAMGGAIVPSIIFMMFNIERESINGWAIPIATDIAFALGVLFFFRKYLPHSLVVFIMALAIIDDIIAVIIIAIFYSTDINTDWLLISTIIFFVLVLFNVVNLNSIIAYTILGLIFWFAILKSGLHATLAGVLIAFVIPAKNKISLRQFLLKSIKIISYLKATSNKHRIPMPTLENRAKISELEEQCHNYLPPLLRLEYSLHKWVAYLIMPTFALANAGIVISDNFINSINNHVFYGVFFGLLLGKPIGIFLISSLFRLIKVITLPSDMSSKHLVLAGLIAGIGFTMSIFIADLTFYDGASRTFLDSSKLGIIFSTICASASVFIFVRLFIKQ